MLRRILHLSLLAKFSLLHLPIQELKIDRSFVTDIDGAGPGAAIVRSNAVQGYHLQRPRPADELTAWLRER